MKGLSIFVAGIVGILALGTAHAQAPAPLPLALAAHWDNYVSTEMDVAYTGVAFLSSYIHTGPAEYAMIRFTPASNANQVQGIVLYDTGLISPMSPIDAIQPAFTTGDTVTGVLIPDLDELVLTDGASGQSFTLCGPNAPKQNPPPASVADTKACGAT